MNPDFPSKFFIKQNKKGKELVVRKRNEGQNGINQERWVKVIHQTKEKRQKGEKRGFIDGNREKAMKETKMLVDSASKYLGLQSSTSLNHLTGCCEDIRWSTSKFLRGKLLYR